MSNKIVQLKDKTFTDNIYPIAGGMAADSITTQMLKDNSVTSDKIDWTTIEKEVYTGTDAFTGASGVTITNTSFAMRYGNMCLFTVRFSVGSTTSGDHALATIRSGFPLPPSSTLGHDELIEAVGYLGTTPIMGFLHPDSSQIDFRVLSSTQISSTSYGAITFVYPTEG